MEDFSKLEKLKGKSNYLGWAKIISSEIPIASENDSEPAKAILRSVTLEIAAVLPTNGLEMWAFLRGEYGSEDKHLLKRQLRETKMVNLELDVVWTEFILALARFKAAGGIVTEEETIDLILENIDQLFFLDVIRKIRLQLLSDKEIDLYQAKSLIREFYNVTPLSLRTRNKSNTVTTNQKRKQCEWCVKHGRIRVQNSHQKEKCFLNQRNT